MPEGVVVVRISVEDVQEACSTPYKNISEQQVEQIADKLHDAIMDNGFWEMLEIVSQEVLG